MPPRPCRKEVCRIGRLFNGRSNLGEADRLVLVELDTISSRNFASSSRSYISSADSRELPSTAAQLRTKRDERLASGLLTNETEMRRDGCVFAPNCKPLLRTLQDQCSPQTEVLLAGDGSVRPEVHRRGLSTQAVPTAQALWTTRAATGTVPTLGRLHHGFHHQALPIILVVADRLTKS